MTLKVNLRRQEILRLLSQKPIATVTELAETINVSQETIRKDLEAMAAQESVIRVHGGVALAGRGASEVPYSLRVNINPGKKALIAGAACKLIEPDDCIILESSTTNVELAKTLLLMPSLLRSLLVITNSFRIADLLSGENYCKRLFFLGGWSSPSEYNTAGHYTIQSLSGFHVDKTFISGAAVSEDLMLTNFFDDNVAFQQTAMRCAKTSILLVDSTKFHDPAVLTVCPISEVDIVVSDVDCEPALAERIRSLGVRLILSE